MKKLLYLLSISILFAVTFSCSKSDDADPTPPASTPGPKFTAAKAVITSSCALSGCHASPSNTGGKNFESDANIVANGARIKATAVDLGTMPPTGSLSAAAKASLTDWINAGGRITD